MKYLRILIWILALVGCHEAIIAQTLRGRVLDERKMPIANADVIDLTKGSHTHSDEGGKFSLESPQIGDSLKIVHLSYEPAYFVIRSLEDHAEIMLFDKSISLDEVVISPRLNALNVITDVDLQVTPVNSSQDLLRQVPGLFIGQHAGGGKAEQLFLRGFDVDHGTDVNIAVDGLPVNMVSHAHGQGYADLHFVIPETLDKIDFGKGPYHADKGDFTTAGYVNFKTKDVLGNSLVGIELGQFDTRRLLAMFDLADTNAFQSYIAAEYLATDGPFDSPQNFDRYNVFGKLTALVSPTAKLGLSVSRFSSKWDASGQIPQRAVNSGMVGRFGAIDDTEGGNTSRTNVMLDYDKKLSEASSIRNKVFYSRYDFELYSNFTFFLDDPVNGDQIRQKEVRDLFGFTSEYQRAIESGRYSGNWRAGISLRNDRTRGSELSHTVNRKETLESFALGDIDQSNIGAFLDLQLQVGKWMFNPALRFDTFDFEYNDALAPTYSTQSQDKGILSPKLNILYNNSNNLQFYLKTGKGFHSNDTRVTVARSGEDILPAAYGLDAGFIWKPIPNLLLNTAYWYLFLEQEFVYVGDAAIVEPSGRTGRQGLDISLRYQPLPWLFANADAVLTRARSIDDPKGEDYIPLAPDLTVTGGLNVILRSGFYGGVDFRHLQHRPANEDNSIVAKGYTVFDAHLGYKLGRFDLGLQVQNLFDTEWNETQFATETRLRNEPTPVDEICFTPGTPFFIKGVVQYKF